MRMTTNANRRVTDEQIERARSIDLVQFLQQYEPPRAETHWSVMDTEIS